MWMHKQLPIPTVKNPETLRKAHACCQGHPKQLMALDFSKYFEAFKSSNCLCNYNIQLMIKQETSLNWPPMTKSHSYSLLVKQ